MEETIEKLKIKNEVLMEMLREVQAKPGSRIELVEQQITSEILVSKFDFVLSERSNGKFEFKRNDLSFLPDSNKWFYEGSRIVGFQTVSELENFLKCTQKIPLI